MYCVEAESVGLSRGLESYKDYVGLKLHFNDQFIFKRTMADGLKNLSVESLMKRKDAYLFVKMGEKFNRDEAFEVLVSLFKNNKDGWIGEVFEEWAVSEHKKRMTILGSLTHCFRTDISKIHSWLSEKRLSLKDAFTSSGSPPMIATSRIPGGVKDETLSLLNSVFRFCDKQTDDPLWERKRKMLDKYSYWLPLEKKVLIDQCERLIQN